MHDGMERRDAVRVMAAAPLAALGLTAIDVQRAVGRARDARRVLGAGQAYAPIFFNDHEWATIRLLVDIIIPRDARSGSATDAGVPEFLDFILDEQTGSQTPIRGGLAWLDTECRERFGANFLDCTETQRTAVLDDIAYPARARPEMSHGVNFFNRLRNLTATGFWSSRMGVADLQYMGNVAVAEWRGCPEEQLRKLGVSYGGER